MADTDGNVTISLSMYEGLINNSNLLAALEAAGVDNWDGYDIAIDMMGEYK